MGGGGFRGGGTSGSRLGSGTVGGAEEVAGDGRQVVEVSFGEASLGVETGLGKENELAEIAEGGGAAGGDTVGGEGFEDAFEGAVNVEAAVLLGKVLCEFGGEVFFDGRAALVDGGVGTAIVADGGGHGALAVVGEDELAEVWEGGVLALRSH